MLWNVCRLSQLFTGPTRADCELAHPLSFLDGWSPSAKLFSSSRPSVVRNGIVGPSCPIGYLRQWVVKIKCKSSRSLSCPTCMYFSRNLSTVLTCDRFLTHELIQVVRVYGWPRLLSVTSPRFTNSTLIHLEQKFVCLLSKTTPNLRGALALICDSPASSTATVIPHLTQTPCQQPAVNSRLDNFN